MASNDPPPNSLAGWTLSIFTDILTNLTHDTVLQAHRNEKLLRTQHHLALHPPSSSSSSASSSSSEEPSNIPLTINPLSILPTEYTCPRCHLPRHTTATTSQGTTATLPTGEKKKFCSKLPYANIPFHDIYGNPFPSVSQKDKKSKASQASADTSSTCGDSPAASTPANGTDLDIPVATGKTGKAGGSAGIIYFKCLNCDNEKVASTRYAAHLEKCLRLAGRKSSRVAMAKINYAPSNGSTGSPLLAPADAKNGSLKPSPEKNGRSPAPPTVEETGATVIVKPMAAVTATPKKKKKLVAEKDKAPAITAPRAVSEDHPASLPRVAGKTLPAPTIPKEPVAAAPKKRKRKTDVAPAAVVMDAGSSIDTEKEKDKEKDKDKDINDSSSIIIASKPPPTKKQKLVPSIQIEKAAPTIVVAPAGGVEATKKSQLSKFKNRAASPAPTGSPRKGVDMNRSRSDGNPGVPTLATAPTSSPPISHKPLPTPAGGSPLKTPKVVKKKAAPKKPVVPGVAQKTLPKIPKKPAVGAGTGAGTGAGSVGSPKKVVKRVTKVGAVAGKSVPGVGRVAGKGLGERK